MDYTRYYSGRAVIFKAIPLSLLVMLRVAPILAAVALVATGLFSVVASNWIALFIVVVMTIAPISYFVMINTIRAALVQLRQTTAPDGMRMVRAAFRVFLFHLITIVPVLALFILGYLALDKFEIISPVATSFRLDPEQEITWFVVISALRSYVGPIFVILSLGCAAYAALLTPMAAVAASVVIDSQPRHGLVFGFGHKAFSLFVVLLLANSANLFGLFLLSPLSAADAIAMSFQEFLFRAGGIVLVTFWSICFVGSAAALAYVSYRNLDRHERSAMLHALESQGGPAPDYDELRSFTLAGTRQETLKAYNPDDQGG